MGKMKNLILLCTAILMLSLLTGCGNPANTASQATPTPATTTFEDNTVSSSAEVVPAKWATLAMPASGIVAEVLVGDGDAVSAGQVLVRLSGQEDAKARVTAAEYTLADAQKNLETLRKNAPLQASQAQKAMADAQKAVEDAQKKVDSLTFPRASDTRIDNTQSKIDLAKKQVALAADRYRQLENKPDGDSLKAQALLDLTNAQINLNNLISEYNWYTGLASNTDADQFRANLALAQAQLADARQKYQILKDGPDPAELKVAQASVTNAEAQLAAAQSALTGLELRAPFGGVISNPRIHPGEYITFGQPVMQLADLATLRVETTDLNETDVAFIQVGDTANVTFDALPGVSLTCKVLSIAPKSSEGSGVNYTVIIDVDEPPPGLRWGMTAFVVLTVTK
jgi:multidrug resistance efflux pump